MDISSKFNPITKFMKDRAEKQQTLQDNAIAKAAAEKAAKQAILDAEKTQQIGAQLQAAAEAGGGYQPTSQEQNVARTASRRTDKGIGQGGVYGLADGGLATMFTRRR